MSEFVRVWKEALEAEIVPGKREILQRFFKTGPGEYGEGDIFLGLTVPSVRRVSRLMTDAPFEAIASMLESPVHDHRLSALLVLVERYRKSRGNPDGRSAIVDFYLSRTYAVNNWDLVDLSAPKILGEYVCATGQVEILHELSNSGNMWEQRIAIVSTWTLLKNGITAPTVEIAERYLTHSHDLIHKAAGWMLREMGKRGFEDQLRNFLDRYAHVMPRTMLRYSIEKLPASSRQHYLELRRQVK